MVLKRVYRMKELPEVTGKCRAGIYKAIRNREFPTPIRLGPKARGWLVSEVDEWLAQRAAERESA